MPVAVGDRPHEHDAGAPPEVLRRWRTSWRWPVALGLVVFALMFVTMPNYLYRGDARAVRIGTANLILYGELGVPYENRDRIPAVFLERRGKYFFENDDTRRIYSKYGVLPSLVYAAPLYAAGSITGELSKNPRGRAVVFWLNLQNIAITVVLSFYLFALATLFTRRRWVALVYVLGALFGTFAWHYLRAQSLEIFHLLCFTGFFTHWCRWVRVRPERGIRSLDFVGMVGFVGTLTLLKAHFGLLFPLAWLALWVKGPRTGIWRDCVAIGLSGAGFASLVLAHNQVLFGDVFEFGYGQLGGRGGRGRGETVHPGQLGAVLKTFLYARPDQVLLLHSFPFFVGLVAWPRLARQHRLEFGLVVVCFVTFGAFVSTISGSGGGWSLGPRHWLFMLPALSVPVVLVLDRLLSSKRRWAPRIGLGILAALLLAFTATSFATNHLEFHAKFSMRHFLSRVPDHELHQYFLRPTWMINLDLVAHKQGKRTFRPIEIVYERRPGSIKKAQLAEYSLMNRYMFRRNYFFWPEAAPKQVIRPRVMKPGG